MKNKFHPRKDSDRGPAREIGFLKLGEIKRELIGERFLVEGIIDSISQTSGPTLFSLDDGTGSLLLKGFLAPGERAHPEINEKDAISAKIMLKEYNNSFEGEIMIIKRLDAEGSRAVKEKIQRRQKEKAAPTPIDFMVQDVILDKLKDRFYAAATEIRLAIFQNRPIIVRHHNDADGYSAGYALEKAIIPLVDKQHGGGKSTWEFYTRAPCSAPLYEIDDSIRDTAHALANNAKFSNKMPLVIIVDNGSTQEDLFAIQQGKVHGIDFIVVDHHFFEKDVISKEVLVHINPFLVGEDGSKFSAGMLCTELGRIINNVEGMEQVPALAGLADRIKNPEAVGAYLKIAESKGYTKELLHEMASIIDFVSAKLRFMEAREYIDVIFSEPRSRQKALVSLMAPYIRGLEQKGLTIAKASAKIEQVKDVYLQHLDVGDAFPGFGFYPKPGKVVGLLHDDALNTKKYPRLVTVGLLSSAITIRASDQANFSVHELIEFLKKKSPEAFVEGGGHKNAGSINFIPKKQEEVWSLFKEYMKSLS